MSHGAAGSEGREQASKQRFNTACFECSTRRKACDKDQFCSLWARLGRSCYYPLYRQGPLRDGSERPPSSTPSTEAPKPEDVSCVIPAAVTPSNTPTFPPTDCRTFGSVGWSEAAQGSWQARATDVPFADDFILSPPFAMPFVVASEADASPEVSSVGPPFDHSAFSPMSRSETRLVVDGEIWRSDEHGRLTSTSRGGITMMDERGRLFQLTGGFWSGPFSYIRGWGLSPPPSSSWSHPSSDGPIVGPSEDGNHPGVSSPPW
jgi:hypothetical protein